MTAIGPYHIDLIGNNNLYKITWIHKEAIKSVIIKDLDKVIENYIIYYTNDKLHFIHIFTNMINLSPELLVDTYPDLIDNLPEEIPNMNYFAESWDEKFTRYLQTFIQAYNTTYQTNLQFEDINEDLQELRNTFLQSYQETK